MSWKPEVRTVNGRGQWSSNALRFATQEEAIASATALMMRWTAVEDTQASESPDPVNYRWDDKLGNVPLDRPQT